MHKQLICPIFPLEEEEKKNSHKIKAGFIWEDILQNN